MLGIVLLCCLRLNGWAESFILFVCGVCSVCIYLTMAGIRTLPTPVCLDDFEVGVTLGTGSFGRVRFATHKVSCFSLNLTRK